MSALAPASENNSHQSTVTSISTSARIDYIHRFSKQAVLVIEQEHGQCSAIVGQYLGALPDDQNSAYLSISPQHDSIQVRCRIVEQLFGNTLFDPEKSLAVTVLNFAKESQQAISIVIEQAHHLSLQILHELCQLALLAKKMQVKIDVLMLGQVPAGCLIAENKSLFAGKLTILDAETGQLINANASLFKKSVAWYRLSKPMVWLISSLLIMAMACIAVVELHQRGIFNFSELIYGATQNTNNFLLAERSVWSQKNSLAPTQSKFKADHQESKRADVKDIFAALAPRPSVNPSVTKADLEPQSQPQKLASPVSLASSKARLQPVLQSYRQPSQQQVKVTPATKAIALKSATKVNRTIAELPVLNNRVKPVSAPKVIPSWAILATDQRISPQYYLAQPEGFVIQFSGFTQHQVFKEFIAFHQLSDFKGYLRTLKGQSFLVITSKVYQTRAEADQALSGLPQPLRDAGIWVKSLASIKNEIAAFATAIH